jgi:hypothetical protein
VADFHHQNSPFAGVDAANEPIIVHPIPPKAVRIAPEWFTKHGGIAGRLDAGEQAAYNALLGHAVQLGQLLLGRVGQ